MKITDEIRKAGLKARDELLERMFDGGTVDNDLADRMESIIDACVRTALTAAPASAEPVKVKEIISNTIGFNFEPNELQTVNADDLLRLAAALTGKLEDAS